MWQKFLYLGLAGALGTISRYCLSGLVHRYTTTEFALGTAVVNIVGCLLFGLLWTVVENKFSMSGEMRMILFVGFFGAFTTFSSFAFESSQLLGDSQWLQASCHILVHNVIGIACVIAGLAVGKSI
jgi:fluoride exporter